MYIIYYYFLHATKVTKTLVLEGGKLLEFIPEHFAEIQLLIYWLKKGEMFAINILQHVLIAETL